VLALIEQGDPVSVFGFPGTGKTLVAELAAAAGEGAGRRVAVVSADRHSAGVLSARIVRRVGSVVEGRPAVTPTSLAMTILEARAQAVAALGLEFALEASRGYQPQMVTGAEQAAALSSLLGGDEEAGAGSIRWPEWILPEARRLTAFRDELRDLLMRAAERGVDAVELDRLGREHGHAEWTAAAQLYQRYLDTLDLPNTADAGLKLDAAAMVAQAHLCLRDWAEPFEVRGQTVELDLGLRPKWDLLIVDDYQEASLALHRLIGELAGLGTQVVCLGSPDTAAQSFRGALPTALAGSTLPAPDGWNAREAVLDRCWRQGGPLLERSVGVIGRLRPAGRSRRAVTPPSPGQRAAGSVAGRVRSVVVNAEAEVAAVIARRFRQAHAAESMPWSNMAVLTRTAGQVGLLRSLLTGAGLPVRVPGSQVLATDHPAVAPLVALMRCAASGEPLSPALAVRLAVSSVGGMDAADLRELRRTLRRKGREAGSALAADELAAQVLNGEGDLGADAVPARSRPAVERLAAALQAGRQAASGRGAGAADVLWAVWEATGLSDLWSGWALAGGPRGTRADADLDAVLALFAAAARHDARKPGSGPTGFVSYLEAQELPSDTIAAQAPEGDRVTVSTAAAAVGREWDLVAIVEVEEDVWPDLRLRDTVLGAGLLADIVDGKGVRVAGPERRREVLEDETRTFALALTRAKQEVLVAAVASTDQQPSQFFRWLAEAPSDSPSEPAGKAVEPGGTASAGAPWVAAGPGWPFDLRGVVAEARAELVGILADGGPDTTCSMPSAQVLAVLSALGVDGAEPAEWPGLVASSVVDRLYPDHLVPVLTPSKVESLANCPLLWALDGAGGRREAGDQASLGTLIHWLAEHYPAAGPEELSVRLDEQWAHLGLEDNYSSRRLKARAAEMVRRLGVYQQRIDREVVAVEASIRRPGAGEEAGLPVRLAGRIDRLEAGSDGGVRVVDFKTGANVPAVAEAATNPQLGSYQVAVNAGLVAPYDSASEAVLVHLSKGADGPKELVQAPLARAEDPDWMMTLLRRCAEDAVGPRFEARPGAHCRNCAVKTSCPAWPEGKQVIA
jgi:superfamily I DNA/RNA helicase/RecB family exonuclease